MDNLLIIGKDMNIINSLKNKLSEPFCIADLGSVPYYLGMSVTQIGKSINLDQKSYLKKVLLQFQIDINKLASLPIDLGVTNSILLASENHQFDKDTIFCYRAVVGLLMYAMYMTHSDLDDVLSMVN